MKSRILTLAALFLAVSVSTAQAQTDATATAAAEILDALEIQWDNTNIDFGNLPASQSEAIFLDPTGENNSNTGTTTTVARFDVTGANSTGITLLYETTITLEDSGLEDSGNSFEFSPKLAHAEESTSQSSATPIDTGSDGLTLSEEGELFIWAGGEIEGGELENQATGTYSGELTLTVEYQ